MAVIALTQFVVQVIFLSVFHSLSLRAATWIFNRLFASGNPTVEAGPQNVESDSETKFEVADAGPYTAPATYSTAQDLAEGVVPTPSFLFGMAVGVTATLIQTILTFVVVRGLFAGMGGPTSPSKAMLVVVGVYGVFLGISASVFVFSLKWWLPTTTLRAMSVTAISYLLLVLCGAVIAVPIMLLMA